MATLGQVPFAFDLFPEMLDDFGTTSAGSAAVANNLFFRTAHYPTTTSKVFDEPLISSINGSDMPPCTSSIASLEISPVVWNSFDMEVPSTAAASASSTSAAESAYSSSSSEPSSPISPMFDTHTDGLLDLGDSLFFEDLDGSLPLVVEEEGDEEIEVLASSDSLGVAAAPFATIIPTTVSAAAAPLFPDLLHGSSSIGSISFGMVPSGFSSSMSSSMSSASSTCSSDEQSSHAARMQAGGRSKRTPEEKLAADRLRKARAYAKLRERKRLGMTAEQRTHLRESGRIAARKSRVVRKARWDTMMRRSEELDARNAQLTKESEQLALTIRALRDEILRQYTAQRL